MDKKHSLIRMNLTGYKCTSCLKSWDFTPAETILATRCDGPRPDFSRAFGITNYTLINRDEIESKGTRADELGDKLLKKAGYD